MASTIATISPKAATQAQQLPTAGFVKSRLETR